VNVVELVNISKVAVVPVGSINSLAFVFLASDVMNYTFHVQGMSDAFVIQFRQSLISNTLVQLNNDCFFEFPDLYPEHQLRYCDCFGRSIFSSIDHLRQELWRFLCRYGQSQGLFPKGTVKFLITEQFSFFYQTSW
jgi:hypothetical protein